jgi:hypothetical protein
MFLPASPAPRVIVRLLWFGALLVVILVVLPVPWTDLIVATHGPLEIAATLFLVAAAWLAARRYLRTREKEALAAAWVLALFAWVKFDPGSWLLHRDADRPGFYLDAAVPLGERAALALLLGGGAFLSGLLVVRLFPRFLAGWRRREAAAVWGGAAVLFLGSSLVIDLFHGRMTWARGFREPGQWPKHQINVLEETLELLAAVLFALAAWAVVRKLRPARADEAPGKELLS